MPKENFNELSSQVLTERKRSHILRYLVTIGLMAIFSLYLGYLDIIKKSENNHTITYIFIVIGVIVITAELLYRLRSINIELKSRTH